VCSYKNVLVVYQRNEWDLSGSEKVENIKRAFELNVEGGSEWVL